MRRFPAQEGESEKREPEEVYPGERKCAEGKASPESSDRRRRETGGAVPCHRQRQEAAKGSSAEYSDGSGTRILFGDGKGEKLHRQRCA